VTVVVNLDARGRLGQADALGEALQELRLSAALGELAGERQPRVGQRLGDQLAALAAWDR
jgi:hypothetical protein